MKRIKILLIILGTLTAVNGQAQLVDDFSDGDFILNPIWQGDDSKFVVASGQLKLQAPPLTGSAFLATPSQAVHEATWEFSLQLDFNPSSSNYSKIYLMADRDNLQGAVNGYFVRVGHTSREVSLFVQTGVTETELIDGLDDRVNLPQVKLKVRVVRDATGAWELFSDVGRTGIYTKEGMVTDVTHFDSRYFGIQCFYTSTRSDKFWFDDFAVMGSVVPDTRPPEVVNIEAIDSISFRASFSEPLEKRSATQTSYVLIDGIGSPANAILMADQSTITWTLQKPLVNGVTYTVKLSAIEDLAGNSMPSTSVSLRYFRAGVPENKSILLTELFPDPTPQIGLPAFEYLELYNRSSSPFDLKGWELSDGSSVATFPSGIILPKTYFVVTSASAAGLFHGNVIGLVNFPSLNNSGDVLTLKDPRGNTIDSLSYSLIWYRDEDKAEGGWSLELIDPDNPCGEADNWTSSEDERGGTPGLVNSVLAHKPDLTAPAIEEVWSKGADGVSILLNESLNRETIYEIMISLTPEISIEKILLQDPARRRLDVALSSELQLRTKYRIEIQGVRDCNSNMMESTSFEFGLSEFADSLDLVINEVLFNPRSGGVDFVELYNASDKFIDLENWWLGNEDSGFPLRKRQLQPHQYVVYTEDPEIVLSQYPNSITKNLIKGDLPSLADDVGNIVLRNEKGKVIDQLGYSREWHSNFLKSDEGVSLERISNEAPTQERNNWNSASSLSGFASPGFSNSQQRISVAAIQEVEILPEVFFPDAGTFDFVQINYRFSQPGRVANVIIFNHHGIIIKRICNNELLGSEGFLRWDGDQENGAKARAGYYVVWFETFHPEGTVTTFRKRVVIAGR